MEEWLILGYWGIRGLGQPLRFYLEYLGLPYQDKRYMKPEEWFGEVAQPPLSNQVLVNLPYVKDGDKWIFESQALYVYLAHKAQRVDLLGTTPDEQVTVAQARGVLQDVFKVFYSLLVLPEEQYQAQKADYIQREVMWLLEKLNKFLDGKKWAAGDNLTYVDFAIYEFEETLQAYDPVVFNQFDALKKHRQEFASLPKIKEYINSDRFLARPFLPPDRCRWY